MKTTSRLLCLVLVLLTAFSCTSLLSISAETYIVDKNFKLTRNANNEITVCGYEGSDTSIAVPSSLIGYDVKYIGDHAFYNETTITDISLPNTLTGMGMGAFYGCSSLESISIPTQCINLGPHLFYGCSSLKDVTLSSVTVDIPRYCFSFCGSLEEITLPSTTKTIGEYAFANCSNLKSVYFDRYVESISPNAFQNSTHVVIYGYKNTYVETYAREQNIAFCALDQDIVTHQVIFYNYDGSVYYMTSVEEGKTAIMPIKPPTKPSTDTHYYVFKSWKGNIVNIQQTEHIYPVFTEYELVEKEDYFVIFLNGDGTILSSQTVSAGEDATLPAAPTKAESASTRYTFTGWDKAYTDIRSDMIISPVFSSQTKTFTVEFLNTDGTTLETFTVSYGESCPIPETTPEKAADDKYTYTFTGWDQDLSVITSDLTVSPVFEAKSTSAPVLPDTTNGTLKVDMVGGSGFTISIDDGASRPQGSVYVNRKTPVGVAVTVTATSSSNSEFIGWIDPATGKVLSTDYTYSFYTSGNDYLRAMYKTDSDGVNMVVFYHDKGNQYWDIQYYAPTDEISFPDGPMHAGFDFMGWDHTAEEIQAKLAAGEDVTVLPVWERQLVYVSITVNGGYISSASGMSGDKYLANSKTTVTANTPAQNQKFAYWTDSTGKVLSYDSVYSFYPAADTTITAVFVAQNADITYQALANVNTFTVADPYGNVSISWYVPEDAMNVEFIGAGLVSVQDKNYTEEAFVHGTTDTNVYDRTVDTDNAIGSYVWTGPYTAGTKHFVKAWVQYKTSDGQVLTLYSDMFTVDRTEN